MKLTWTVRTRITAAAGVAMLAAYSIVATLMIFEVTELNNDADSIQAAVVVLGVVTALDDGGGVDDLVRNGLVDDATVVIIEDGEVVSSGGPQSEALTDMVAGSSNGLGSEGDVIDVAGTRHAHVEAPCSPGAHSDCIIVVAVPTDGFVSTLLDNIWTVLALAAITSLATITVVWWIVGRALRFLDGLSSEVNEISDSRDPHRLSRPQGDDEVRRLVDTLNDMLGRLHDAQRQEQRFLADASHELRSPVTAISITTENVAADPERRSSDATWERLTAEADRLRRVVDQLLTLSTTEQSAPMMEPVDVASVVRGHVASLGTSMQVDITLEVRGLAFAITTEGHADRVCSNLLGNAVRHARTAVHVDIAATTDRVVLRISDDGPGVPPDRRDDVFDAFTRLDDARTADGGGSGLGLAIARSAARACGGDIVLEGPNTFVCSLPAPPDTT